MPAHRVYDMDFDEVSTVDVPANQHGLFVLAKRATHEETTVPRYFDAEGNEFDPAELEIGDIVLDEDGDPCEIVADDGNDVQLIDEDELVGVGKSAFFEPIQTDIFKALQGDLQAAGVERGTQMAIAKAFEAQERRSAELSKQVEAAHEIAKAAQDRENDYRYTELAKGYNVPVDADELGPVLKRCAESLSDDDCAVLHKAFSGAGDMFRELGVDGGAEAFYDPYDEVEAYANEAGAEIAKSAGREVVSKEAARVAFYDANPQAYNEYRRARG